MGRGTNNDTKSEGKGFLVYSLKAYAVGAFVVAAILIGNGVANGGLDRHHDLKGWLGLIAIYFAVIAFWPVLIVVGILQLLGIVRMPLTLFG